MCIVFYCRCREACATVALQHIFWLCSTVELHLFCVVRHAAILQPGNACTDALTHKLTDSQHNEISCLT
jgi:hypothetical protein